MRGYGCHDCTAPATHRTLTWPYRYACKKHTAKLAYHSGAMWVQLRPTHPKDPR